MRLDISITAKRPEDMIKAMKGLIEEIKQGKVESNCFISENNYDMDYIFTDCKDVHSDNASGRELNRDGLYRFPY